MSLTCVRATMVIMQLQYAHTVPLLARRSMERVVLAHTFLMKGVTFDGRQVGARLHITHSICACTPTHHTASQQYTHVWPAFALRTCAHALPFVSEWDRNFPKLSPACGSQSDSATV